MIKKYIYGNPITTNAVAATDIITSDEELQYFNEIEMGGDIILSYTMNNDDIVYGLGEANRGINKRGGIYSSYCTDDPNQTEEKRSFYGAHNFLVISGLTSLGVFIDMPGEVTFDIGYTSGNILNIRPGCGDFVLYIIEGDSAYDVIRQFRAMIGRSYIAPRWAFGFQQSRWSYMNEDEIREVVRNHR